MACTSLRKQDAARRAGYYSPTSRESPEIQYATYVYSESPPRKSESPSSRKRFNVQLEAEMAKMSSDSNDFNPAGKSPEEIVA